jgi:hypothetical protein
MKFTDFFAEEKYFFYLSSKEYNLRSRCNIFLKIKEDINANYAIFCLNTHQIIF